MSEAILKALMQLFAIIARPESNKRDRKSVVESFLNRLLNQELVKEYMKVFDDYYSMHQKKQEETDKSKKRTSSSSVRVLKICTEINEELTLQQKVIVLIRLLEFVKSDEIITEQELVFISTVADTFFIAEEEYLSINKFVLDSFDTPPETPNILVINNNSQYKNNNVKHLYSDNLKGEIRILNIASTNIFLIRFIKENELYLNGQLLQEDKVFIITPGSSIRNPKIKPIYYGDIVSSFNIDRLKSKIVFAAQNVGYNFKSGAIGLHKINFTEESGKLIGIMGASGAGKSTLLNVLNGSYIPTSGEILVNGINIHNEKEKIEGLIGYVSQDDLLIEELTVFQNLYYNAKLCFDNYTDEKIEELVLDLLKSLGLYEIKDMRVGSPLNKKISGGQRKRLNISLELIREPAILFLDEPTSGLSSRDSENILDLLKELALKGKLVFVVIHQPSSDIFKMFDKLLILDNGGYLIYNGDPIDSILYFKSLVHQANWNESECHVCGNVNPEQIFNIVEANVLDEFGKITSTRKVLPKEWNTHYNQFSGANDSKPLINKEIPENNFKVPNRFKQFIVFVTRDVLSKLSNTQYLIINLLEAPALAFLLSYIIKYYNVNVTNLVGYNYSENSNIPVFIFMSVIIAIFIGLTVSAEEIIKDKKILKRESFLNLSRFSYLLSKIAVLLVISAIQAFLFVSVGNSIIEIKGMFFQYWFALFSAWVSANIMGLVISDSFKTVITIYILIPFLVIPQLILSGIIVKYEKLNPSISSPINIPIYGEIITARWAYEALAVYQFKENPYEKKFYIYDKAMSLADYKKNYWLKTLNNKLDYCKRNLDDPLKKDEIIKTLIILRNEIKKEIVINTLIRYSKLDELYYNKINPVVIEDTEEYFSSLNKYYIKLYNKANNKKDNLISDYQKTSEGKEIFLKLKRSYYNESLAEMLENSNEIERIIEYQDQLIQKIDPIYQDPKHKFLKAHFYTPQKRIFGKYYSTYWVNIVVIWIITILLYIVLYYQLLKKLLDFMGEFSGRFGKKQ